MTKYELKKIFYRRSSKISLFVLLFVMVITCYFAIDVTYVNEQGVTERGYAATKKLREEKSQWAGFLDEGKLRAVIRENVSISATPESMSNDYQENDIAYSWKQGFSDIRDLLNSSFADGFREYNYYKADSLQEENAKDFYQNRITLLKTWLYDTEGDVGNLFSEQEKTYLVTRYESLATPLYYEDMDGWLQCIEYASTVLMIFVLIIGYLVAGIFSSEFGWHTDAVLFTTEYGRSKAVSAKIKAGLLTVTIIYWIVMLLYSSIVLSYLGIQGANCPVQVNRSGWKCFYSITILQEYLLVIFGGYVASLFISLLVMLVSAKTKSTVLAVIVPFILIFIPSFLSEINSGFVSRLLGLLPDQLLQMNVALGCFNLYTIAGKVIGAIPIILILYCFLTVILLPIIYRVYRKTQIA